MLALLPASAAANPTTQIIVKRDPGLSAAERRDIRADAGVRFVESLPLPRTEVVVAPEGELREAVNELNADPDVAFAAPDRFVHALSDPDDPAYPSQWGLPKISMPAAWDMSLGTGRSIAVVDSGVAESHPDLAGRLAPGFDWVEADTVPNDPDGHGTHVTGTIAALRDNGVGVAGVAPLSRVLPLRVLDDKGTGRLSDILEAFEFVRQEGVRVVNASFGAQGANSFERAAIAAADKTLFVVAAGNSNLDNDGANATYPCAYDLANVLCVGASDVNDAKASFSNYGSTSVDVFAPGVEIVSTTNDGAYGFKNGTSMAAPHVAGLAGLLLARNPDLSVAAVKQAIVGTVDPTPGLAPYSLYDGRVNAQAALASVTADRDGDGVADVPDNCPDVANEDQDVGQTDVAGGAACETGADPIDVDGDGVMDPDDACPYETNAESPVGCPGTMGDGDADGQPDMLDDCLVQPGSTGAQGCPDQDGDGIADLKPSGARDNCVSVPNADQTDTDLDGTGDACDPTPRGHDNDRDNLAALDDDCPNVYGTLPNGCVPDAPTPAADTDGDGRADGSDGCPTEYAFSNDGCPLAQVSGMSAKARKRGKKRSAKVTVTATRLATMRITVERKAGRRWVRVIRRTISGTDATLRISRLKRGRHRVRVSISSSGGTGTSASYTFPVR